MLCKETIANLSIFHVVRDVPITRIYVKVTEKESLLKFGLIRTGLSEAAYFGSVFVHEIAPISVLSSGLITGALYVDKVARFSNVGVVWGFLFVYLIATTAYVCFLSTLIAKASTVQNTVALFTFLAAVIYIAFLSLNLDDGIKFALSVVPMFAMHFIGDRMVVLEGNNLGLTWETITEPFPLAGPGSASCTLLWVGFYMLVSCLLWLYLAWYAWVS